ncbi:DUF3180 domain-containing protein [Plantactinospora siamensis]|uniref:DUF3180 domain-containing protein n=1 Tax=Plantactinospora siamensis TaxID=555372 RepID=A0ABV6P4Y7_9ACTN
MSDRSSPPRPPAPNPTMGPTRPASLVVAGLASAALAWLLVSSFYADLPALPWLPAVTLAGLAVLEAYAALTTRARIDRRPGREPVEPLTVARYAVLAKASSLVGAIFGGFWAGLVLWLVVERTKAASDDLPAAVAGLVASLCLIAAALWLERACRVPERPDDDEDDELGR